MHAQECTLLAVQRGQSVGNRLLTPLEHAVRPSNNNAPIERRERLGGLLNFDYRRAA